MVPVTSLNLADYASTAIHKTLFKQAVLRSLRSQVQAAQMPLPNTLLWFRHRSVNDLADANQPDATASCLRTLPSELLQMIALQLSLSDAASFALINRRLSMLIGPTYWPRLRTSAVIQGHREQFLNTLARDLPSWFYCHSCSHLHPRDRVGPPGPFNQPSKPLWCLQTNSGGDLWPYVHVYSYTFNFHHLQLVMLRHYLGPGYGISTDELSFIQVSESGKSEPRGRITTLLSVEARVCGKPARLCLRLQTWAVLHTRLPDLALERSKCVWVCHHLVADEGEMFQLIESSLNENSTRSERPREPKCHRCRRCNFNFQLEVLDTVSDGLAIVITKWLDLGSGLTPMDPKWRILASAFQDGENRNEQVSEAEKCKTDFEKEEGMMQQAVTLRNASYLSDQRYKNTMSKWLFGEWTLQAGQRMHLCHWSDILLLSLGLLGLMLCAVIWQSACCENQGY